MREILFRGKRIDNGEWVEGSLLKVTIKGQTVHLIFGDNFSLIGGNVKALSHAMVDPATVGQFTCLTDKNGKKIFEGDIVEGHCHSRWSHRLQRCEVVYDRDGFEARHHVLCASEKCYYTYKVLFSKDVAVIGNIHDNPELLEG
jgi:uncharacterized phage protein (TIGR01671 family)